jgi:hypothetical protein
MLGMAVHLRGQDLSLREIAARLVITGGKKKGRHPSAATVLRMLREHDEKAAALGDQRQCGAQRQRHRTGHWR